MDIAYQTVSFFYHLSLIVWLGGIIVISFIVAPAVFGTLPSKSKAGEVIRPIHHRFQTVQFFCMLVLLITSMIKLRIWENLNTPLVIRYLFIFAMVVLAVFHGTIVIKKLRVIRQQITNLDDLPATDPRRLEFASWHRISVFTHLAILICGLGALFLS